MAYRTLEVVPSAARTANGAGSSVAAGYGASNLNLILDVAAASGTSPSLAVQVEWSFDGGTTFVAAGDTFAAKTGTGKELKTVPVRAPYFRLSWTITGTSPSFTFSSTAYTT